MTPEQLRILECYQADFLEADSRGIEISHSQAQKLARAIQAALDERNRILQWTEAYPLDVFPEPDLKKAAKVLKDNGMTLDSISASNFCHVLNGIKDILGRNNDA